MIAFGMRVIEHEVACTYERARPYAKRKAKTEAHWRRMDKKYLKRYGMRAVPRCFQMGDALIVHPSLMPELRRVFKELPPARSAIGSFWL